MESPVYGSDFLAAIFFVIGFGQDFPMDPKTYVLPYKELDVTKFKSITDLPVFSMGCDSSYSWDSKFKRLAKDYTVQEIVDELDCLGKKELGVEILNKDETMIGTPWIHNKTQTESQLCFTGGEPMLQQKAMNDICEKLLDHNACPPQITIETNATKPIIDLNIRLLTQHLHISCSPKLYAVSGEKNVVDFNVIESYMNYADSGCLKFVHNGSKEAWLEMDWVVNTLSPLIQGTPWKFYIMPVGSTLESQNPEHIENIVKESLKRGFNISMRSHIQAFGNKIGT